MKSYYKMGLNSAIGAASVKSEFFYSGKATVHDKGGGGTDRGVVTNTMDSNDLNEIGGWYMVITSDPGILNAEIVDNRTGEVLAKYVDRSKGKGGKGDFVVILDMSDIGERYAKRNPPLAVSLEEPPTIEMPAEDVPNRHLDEMEPSEAPEKKGTGMKVALGMLVVGGLGLAVSTAKHKPR